jgi:hypothetical protein
MRFRDCSLKMQTFYKSISISANLAQRLCASIFGKILKICDMLQTGDASAAQHIAQFAAGPSFARRPQNLKSGIIQNPVWQKGLQIFYAPCLRAYP